MKDNSNDLIGQRFGSLCVIKKSEQKAKSGSMWICKCDCGCEIVVTRCNLKSGNTKSCGCKTLIFANKTRVNRGTKKDLTGQTFGNLTVIRASQRRSGTNPMWVCVCTCGNQTEVIQENLLNGHTKSCGCLSSRHILKELARTHGDSHSRL